jgi:hypothetical protein
VSGPILQALIEYALDAAEDAPFDRAACAACGRHLATIWPVEARTATPGAHTKSGGAFYSPETIGFRIVLAAGLVNDRAPHANGLPLYTPQRLRRTGQPVRELTTNRSHFVVACWCGRDNEIGPTFFGYPTTFRDAAQAKSQRRAPR